MPDGCLEIDALRACCHDGFASVSRCSHESSLIHEAKRMSSENGSVVICLVGKHHFDHGDVLRDSLRHGIWPSIKRGHGETQLKKVRSPCLPSEACAFLSCPVWTYFVAGLRTCRLPTCSSFPVHG